MSMINQQDVITPTTANSHYVKDRCAIFIGSKPRTFRKLNTVHDYLRVIKKTISLLIRAEIVI